MIAVLLAWISWIAMTASQQFDCQSACNDLRFEVLTTSMCREAKRTLPRPKVGDFCSTAMEQAFNDVCLALCREDQPVSRIATVCRSAALEMPRPTVRKWCEHGYKVAFSKTYNDLKDHFGARELSIDSEAVEIEQDVVEDVTINKDKTTISNDIPVLPPSDVLMTISITLDETPMSLVVLKGQDPEDAVAIFCQKHIPDDLSGCIRQLLPDVLDRLQES